MEVIIFIMLVVIFIFFIDYIRFKKELYDFLTDLFYDLELLKIDNVDYKFKVDKLFNKKD